MNKCDGCTLCCDLFPVKWLNKPPIQKCQHSCPIGCAIQDTKPDECRNFDCLYIEDNLTEKLKPNKIGIVFERIMTRVYFGTMESNDNWDNDDVSEYVKELNQQGISVVFSTFVDNTVQMFLAEGHTKEGITVILNNALEGRNIGSTNL